MTKSNLLSSEAKNLENSNISNKKERTYEPARQNDNWRITYSNFASNKEQTNLRANGKDLKNDELLRLQGFEKNSNGEMTLSAAPHKPDRDKEGNVIKRTTLDGRILTDDRPKIEKVGQER